MGMRGQRERQSRGRKFLFPRFSPLQKKGQTENWFQKIWVGCCDFSSFLELMTEHRWFIHLFSLQEVWSIIFENTSKRLPLRINYWHCCNCNHREKPSELCSQYQEAQMLCELVWQGQPISDVCRRWSRRILSLSSPKKKKKTRQKLLRIVKPNRPFVMWSRAHHFYEHPPLDPTQRLCFYQVYVRCHSGLAKPDQIQTIPTSHLDGESRTMILRWPRWYNC